MYGYRKYSACLIAVSLASILCWYGKIGDQVYATVVLATVGAFIAGNTLAKRDKV